jgi:RNA polymerase subunit RPABC4/transcription elongation factor Spt4
LRRKPRATSAPTVPTPRMATRSRGCATCGRCSDGIGSWDWGQRNRDGAAADGNGRVLRRSAMVPEVSAGRPATPPASTQPPVFERRLLREWLAKPDTEGGAMLPVGYGPQVCPRCGMLVAPGAAWCAGCGLPRGAYGVSPTAPYQGGYSACLRCGTPRAWGAAWCPRCGYGAGSPAMPQFNFWAPPVACPRCGTLVAADAIWCPWCGLTRGV